VAALPPDEDGAQGDAGRDRQPRDRSAVAGRHRLDPDHDGEHRGEGGRRADQVEGRACGVTGLGQQPGTHRQQQEHRRHGQEEDGGPVRGLQDGPAGEWSDEAADREARRPHAERLPALGGFAEHRADQREGGRHERRPGHPEQAAARDQCRGARGRGGEHRRRGEGRGPDQEEAPAAYAVSQHPHGQQRAGAQEHVEVHDPQQLPAVGVQVGRDPRQGQVEQVGVHRDDQARQGQHREPGPLPAGRAGRAVRR
jgi:hypothetical protein